MPHAAVATSLCEAPACSNCILLASPTGRRLQTLEIAATVSRRKHLFSSAASSGVRGGTNRVFTRPGCGALVMTANAQKPRSPRSGRFGSRTRNCFIRYREEFFTAQEDDL